MASVKRPLAATCLLLALTMGCASPPPRSAESGGSFQAGEMRLDALEPQTLESGACGMFLWARTEQTPVFVFAAFASPAEARVRPNGRVRVLQRTSVGGEARYGHFETQAFSEARLTIETEVQFSTTRPLRDGAVIEEGVIRLSDREGWQTIIPVTGMVACQS